MVRTVTYPVMSVAWYARRVRQTPNRSISFSTILLRSNDLPCFFCAATGDFPAPLLRQTHYPPVIAAHGAGGGGIGVIIGGGGVPFKFKPLLICLLRSYLAVCEFRNGAVLLVRR